MGGFPESRVSLRTPGGYLVMSFRSASILARARKSSASGEVGRHPLGVDRDSWTPHYFGESSLRCRRVGALAAALCLLFCLLPVQPASALITVGVFDTPGTAETSRSSARSPMSPASGLRVIDVSDPAAPVEIGAVDTPGSAEAVEVVGEIAYVAAYSAGLRVIDVSNPTAPFRTRGPRRRQRWRCLRCRSGSVGSPTSPTTTSVCG